MRLASWNVNSLKVRLPHLLDWLREAQPHALGLQETKTIDEKFPKAEVEAAGYHVVFSGQPTYNGVAILARQDTFDAPREIRLNDQRLPDEQRRLIACSLRARASGAELRFINVYVPNGAEVGSEKFTYKLAWLEALRAIVADELEAHPSLCLVGDFNIAPSDLDVHSPKDWDGKILCSEAERTALAALTDLGLSDSLRLCDPTGSDHFSWWDYRQAAFRRNLGLRIDLVLLSRAIAGRCTGAQIDRAPRSREQPSDHAPVWADVSL